MDAMKPLSDLNLEWLRVFQRVAQTGAMTAAARSLCITQPAVSHAVAQLEDRLGMRLFDRSTKRISLTPEGELLFGITSRMFKVLESGTRELRWFLDERSTVLRIGCPFLILHKFLTPFLSAFHQRHGNVKIQLEIENRMEPMLDLVREDKVDLLFLATPRPGPVDEGLEHCQVGAYRYGFVASRAHYGRLQGRRLTLEDINRHPIIILRPGNNTRDWLERAFADAGLELNVQVETKTMAETDEFVRAGFGIGAVMLDVPEKAAEPGGDVFEVKTRKTVPQGRYLAVYRKGTQLTAAAREFLAGVRRGIAL